MVLNKVDSETERLMNEGQAAVKRGDKAMARALLTQLLERDPQNEQGWLWLSGTLTDPHEQQTCLENVLAINPQNIQARKGLEHLVRKTGALSSGPLSSVEGTDSKPGTTLLPAERAAKGTEALTAIPQTAMLAAHASNGHSSETRSPGTTMLSPEASAGPGTETIDLPSDLAPFAPGGTSVFSEGVPEGATPSFFTQSASTHSPRPETSSAVPEWVREAALLHSGPLGELPEDEAGAATHELAGNMPAGFELPGAQQSASVETQSAPAAADNLEIDLDAWLSDLATSMPDPNDIEARHGASGMAPAGDGGSQGVDVGSWDFGQGDVSAPHASPQASLDAGPQAPVAPDFSPFAPDASPFIPGPPIPGGQQTSGPISGPFGADMMPFTPEAPAPFAAEATTPHAGSPTHAPLDPFAVSDPQAGPMGPYGSLDLPAPTELPGGYHDEADSSQPWYVQAADDNRPAVPDYLSGSQGHEEYPYDGVHSSAASEKPVEMVPCPYCHAQVADTWLACPECRFSFFVHCIYCHELIDTSDAQEGVVEPCPYCSQEISKIELGLMNVRGTIASQAPVIAEKEDEWEGAGVIEPRDRRAFSLAWVVDVMWLLAVVLMVWALTQLPTWLRLTDLYG